MLKKATFITLHTCIHRRNREKPSNERRVPQLSALSKIWMNILENRFSNVYLIIFFTSLCAVYYTNILFQFDKKNESKIQMHLYPNWIFHLHSEIHKETKNSKMFKLKLQSRNNTKYFQGQSVNDEVECLEECNCYIIEISLCIKL